MSGGYFGELIALGMKERGCVGLSHFYKPFWMAKVFGMWIVAGLVNINSQYLQEEWYRYKTYSRAQHLAGSA